MTASERARGAGHYALLASAIASSAGLVILAWTGSFARLVADDFCTASYVRRMGIWGYVAHQYQSWSGRFSFHFFTAVVAAGGVTLIRILPALIVIALTGSIMFAARRAPLAVPLVIAWVVAGASPSQFQSFFWAAGSVTYTLPLVLVALWIGFAISVPQRRAIHLLLFLAAGFAETLTALLLATLAIGAVAWREKRSAFIGGFVAALAGAIVMVAAPGNFVRAREFEATRAAGRSARFVAQDLAQFSAVETAIAGAGLLQLAAVAASAAPKRERVDKRVVTAVVAGVVVCLIAPFAIGRAAMGIPVPLRALQPTHAALVLAAALGGWGARLSDRGRFAAAIIALLLLGFTAIDIRNTTQMTTSAAGFAREWDAMDEGLRASRGARAMVVRAPRTLAGLHFVEASPGFWTNQCMADYYGIGAIRGVE